MYIHNEGIKILGGAIDYGKGSWKTVDKTDNRVYWRRHLLRTKLHIYHGKNIF